MSTRESISNIVDDIKTSWYFRVWAVLWFVCAVVVFAALIILGGRSAEAAREDDFRFWIENATSIAFPQFHFRLEDDNEAIDVSTIRCRHTELPVNFGPCNSGLPMTLCFTVLASSIVAQNVWNHPRGDRIVHCSFNATVPPNDNLMVAWEAENPQATRGFGFDTQLVAPNNNAWITLVKEVFRPVRARRNYDNGTDGFINWGAHVVYHSTVSVPGHYSITTAIESFRVAHIEQSDTYDGWMAMGDIGGFAFFLLILHSIVVFVVGIFLSNESKFLHGMKAGSVPYASLG
jgi:hypothetical protein